MNIRPSRFKLFVAFNFLLVLSPLGSSIHAAESSVAIPVIIDDGFQMWAKKGTASYSFDFWKKGGLLEDDAKPGTLNTYFSRLDGKIGAYRSYEIVEAKAISTNSKVIYLAVNFERAAVYGRFLVYRTGKNWVVQNMDFNLRPEAVMPWLAFSSDSAAQSDQ